MKFSSKKVVLAVATLVNLTIWLPLCSRESSYESEQGARDARHGLEELQQKLADKTAKERSSTVEVAVGLFKNRLLSRFDIPLLIDSIATRTSTNVVGGEVYFDVILDAKLQPGWNRFSRERRTAGLATVMGIWKEVFHHRSNERSRINVFDENGSEVGLVDSGKVEAFFFY